MYSVKLGDLFNILDRGCGSIIVFREYDNSVLFSTAHNSVASKDLEKVKDAYVVQVSNYNGDEWRIHVRQ